MSILTGVNEKYYNWHELHGGLRMFDPDKRKEMWQNYFPDVLLVQFRKPDKNSNEYYLDEISDILDDYIEPENDAYYLNLPKMAKKDLFKPLFPDNGSEVNCADGLNKIKESGGRPDIIKYFITKEDKLFAAVIIHE